MPPGASWCTSTCDLPFALHRQDKESLEAWAAMAAGVAELCCGLAAEIANSSLDPDVSIQNTLLALLSAFHRMSGRTSL